VCVCVCVCVHIYIYLYFYLALPSSRCVSRQYPTRQLATRYVFVCVCLYVCMCQSDTHAYVHREEYTWTSTNFTRRFNPPQISLTTDSHVYIHTHMHGYNSHELTRRAHAGSNPRGSRQHSLCSGIVFICAQPWFKARALRRSRSELGQKPYQQFLHVITYCLYMCVCTCICVYVCVCVCAYTL
jgi:hypothetical protein